MKVTALYIISLAVLKANACIVARTVAVNNIFTGDYLNYQVWNNDQLWCKGGFSGTGFKRDTVFNTDNAPHDGDYVACPAGVRVAFYENGRHGEFWDDGQKYHAILVAAYNQDRELPISCTDDGGPPTCLKEYDVESTMYDQHWDCSAHEDHQLCDYQDFC